MAKLSAAILAIRRELRALWLRYEIAETEAYLADCARDGLIHSLHLDEWRTRLAEMRVELATLAPPLKQPVTPTLNRSRT
jgi:hypothetical protein